MGGRGALAIIIVLRKPRQSVMSLRLALGDIVALPQNNKEIVPVLKTLQSHAVSMSSVRKKEEQKRERYSR